MENHRCRAGGLTMGELVVIVASTVYDDIVGRRRAQPASAVTAFIRVRGS